MSTRKVTCWYVIERACRIFGHDFGRSVCGRRRCSRCHYLEAPS